MGVVDVDGDAEPAAEGGAGEDCGDVVLSHTLRHSSFRFGKMSASRPQRVHFLPSLPPQLCSMSAERATAAFDALLLEALGGKGRGQARKQSSSRSRGGGGGSWDDSGSSGSIGLCDGDVVCGFSVEVAFGGGAGGACGK